MAPWQMRVSWKVATRIDVARIDIEREPRAEPRHLGMITRERNQLVTEVVVENHEAGLLHVEGRLVERLRPGRHAYWTAGPKIGGKPLRPRPQAGRVTPPEELTKDRIRARVQPTA